MKYGMKKLATLLIFMELTALTIPAAAHALDRADDCSTAPPPVLPQAKQGNPIEAIISKLDTPAGCTNLFLEEARTQYDRSFPASVPRREARIEGVTLRGTPEELDFLQRMIRSLNIFLHTPLPRWTQVVAKCAGRDAVCALAELFGGEEAALRALSLAQDTGYLISASQELNIAPHEQYFSPREIRLIDRMTRALPSKFHHMPAMNRFVRIHDRLGNPYNPNGAAAAVNNNGQPDSGRIEIYGKTFDKGNVWAAQVIIHELAHQFDRHWTPQPEHRATGFAELSGWDRGRKVIERQPYGSWRAREEFQHAPDAKFVREYASNDPLEDFADTVGYFVADPAVLKHVSPEKYALIRDRVFDGREYLGNPPWNPSPLLDDRAAGELAARCLGRMKNIQAVNATTPSRPDSFPVLSYSIDSPSRAGAKPEPTALWKEDQNFPKDCPIEVPAAVRVELERDLDTCYRSPPELVPSQLAERAHRILVELLGDFPEFLKKLEKKETASPAFSTHCGRQKDFRADCALRAYLEENSVARAAWGRLAPSTRQTILDSLARELKLPHEALGRELPAPRLIAECFARQHDFVSGWDGKIFIKNQANSSYYHATDLFVTPFPGCAESTHTLLTLQGYSLPEVPAWKKAFQNFSRKENWTQSTDQFVAEVLQPTHEAFQSQCRGLPKPGACRQAAFNKALVRWAAKNGLSPSELKPLEEALFKRISF